MQIIENNVYRRILRAPSYTPVTVLRGEVGASLMKTRHLQSKINYLKSILTGRNKLLQKVLQRMEVMGTKSKWITGIKKCLEEVGLSYESVKEMEWKDIRKALEAWDTNEWKDEMELKSTLEVYREFKSEIKEEVYHNDEESRIFFQIRSNTLNINDRRRHEGRSMQCELCGAEKEDLEHFLLVCGALEEERRKIIKLQRPQEEDQKKIIGELLFGDRDEREKLYVMWIKRKQVIENNLLG